MDVVNGRLKAYALNCCRFAPLSCHIEYDPSMYTCKLSLDLLRCTHKTELDSVVNGRRMARILVIVNPQSEMVFDDMKPLHICTLTRIDGVETLSLGFLVFCFLASLICL